MSGFIQSILPFGNRAPAMAVASVNKQWTTAQDGLDKLKFTEAEVPQPKDGEVLVKVLAVSLNYRDTEDGAGLGGPSAVLGHVRDRGGEQVVADQDGHAGHVHLQPEPPDGPGDGGGHGDGARAAAGWGADRVPVLRGGSAGGGAGLHDGRGGGVPADRVGDGVDVHQRHAAAGGGGGRNQAGGAGDGAAAGHGRGGGGGPPDRAGGRPADHHHVVVGRQAGAGQDGARGGRGHQLPDALGVAGPGAGGDAGRGGVHHLRDGRGAHAAQELREDEAAPPGARQLNVNVLALRRNVTLRGILNGPRDRFEEMVRFYEQHEIRPVVSRVFAMDEADKAFAFLHSGGHFGKVVIKVADK
ncbi:hypothetical protein AK830_g3142 [Neonectria ditissima]|uniref:Enoyl reductase (ER) domain-containing protein n=1 Tax=Neonectria ditissima TaxID=78410 RepID=A0A0P7BQS0_9HYPO|nr:hypothetical protein AK830_g3142 [Neonectria ditissima]